MRTYLYIILVLSIFISGCIDMGNVVVEDGDSFTSKIVKNYPELLDKEYEIEVIKRIVDGDTFVTVSGHKVRMIGMNTPEVFGEAQYYGQEASDFSKQRLEGQTVYLFKDVSETDKYDRWLRFVFIEDEPIMFNETLIMEGYANTMSLPPDVLFTKKFSRLKREAQNDGIGLWGEADSTLSCDNPKIKGNINSRNEKIFHVPGGERYIETKAEMMFCKDQEAIASGFRQAGR
ncbi:thermonuclease family protein [Paenibacillus sp. FA6]|uniref:thermonuclease family protein n=1 Tax=Paenibacillus sp. FA6 TaxID=3413029 RepID=UPI003F65717A